MTRFARAKGSKASNEKVLEPATSWSEMKQDLLNKNQELETRKQREEFAKKREENYQNFLQEKQEELDAKVSWAAFPETTENGLGKRKNNNVSKSKSPKKPKIDTSFSEGSDGELDVQFESLKSKLDKVLVKSKNGQVNGHGSESDAPPEEAGVKEQLKDIVVKKTKKPKQKLKIILDKEDNNATTQKSTEKDNKVAEIDEALERKREKRRRRNKQKKLRKQDGKEGKIEEAQPVVKEELSEVDKEKLEKKRERRRKQKEKMKLKKQQSETTPKSEEDLKKIQKKKDKLAKQVEKRKTFKEANVEQLQNTDNNEKITPQILPQTNGLVKQFPNKRPFDGHNAKKAKPRDNMEHPSRKAKPEKMFINGKTVDVDYIDGFPVKKEDADRLKKLRKEMISKGLPRSEINASLKLERRRAEKAFAREKKNVCFNCRKSGHNLSECPELDKDQTVQTAGTGICFKCGSTEHTHFECKVVRGLDYKFANCFICKEQGHIAKQCPDNQRGLYPKGGSCKVCGDVTHLKKDCPKYQAQQARLQNAFSIGTMDNANPDDLDSKGSIVNVPSSGPKKLNKVIKF